MRFTARIVACCLMSAVIIAACVSTGAAVKTGMVMPGLEGIIHSAALSKDTNNMGYSVWISPDGRFSLIGAPYMYYGDLKDLGSVALVDETKEKEIFLLEPKMARSKAPFFGCSLAANHDASLVIVGASGTSAATPGDVYVFTRPESGWPYDKGFANESLILSAVDESPGDRFGQSLALSGDGNYILVGAPGNGAGAGSAYLFRIESGTWSEDVKNVMVTTLHPLGQKAGDQFGASVAMSTDGSILLFGSPGKDNKGAAFIFVKPAAGWQDANAILVYPIILDIDSGSRFGTSVAMSRDGTVMAVGAPGANNGAGAIFIFSLDREKEKFNFGYMINYRKAPGSTVANVGVSLAVSKDGMILAAGAADEKNNGVVFYYKATADNWEKYSSGSIGGQKAGSLFGFSLALTEDASKIIIGAPMDNQGGGQFYYRSIPK